MKPRIMLLAASELLCAMMILSCSKGTTQSGTTTSPLVDLPTDAVADFGGPAVGRSGAAFSPTAWCYMLQGNVKDKLAGTGFDVVVMDYSKDGTDAGRYTSSEIADMKASGARKLIAYMSIGEAESYRWYWSSSWKGGSSPAWLGIENPDWDGNYKVRYWNADWQAIIYKYLDKVLADGFDGVYLDIVDAYSYWTDSTNGEPFHLSAAVSARLMIDFIARIAEYARASSPYKNSAFVVMPQNAEEITDYDASSYYKSSIDGIGIEDLFYNVRSATSGSDRSERESYLDALKAEGKTVAVVDYVWAGSADATVTDFRSLAASKGYLPYAAATSRALDSVVTFSGQGK